MPDYDIPAGGLQPFDLDGIEMRGTGTAKNRTVRVTGSGSGKIKIHIRVRSDR
jgi:hypothetical protein